jgi:type VI secretion system protein ImpH
VAAPVGSAQDPVVQAILADPTSQGFFHAVRWLWRTCATTAPGGSLPRVGEAKLPSRDVVRFTQPPSLAFAPSTLERAVARRAGGYDVGVRFFGLLGPQGPLPLHITEEAIRRGLDEKDRTFEDFLNLFNHRLISFYYRAWASQQMTVDADDPKGSRIARYIGSLCGLEREDDRTRDSLTSSAKLYFAGVLALPTRPADGLEGILAEYFDMPAKVEPFAGAWVEIPRSMRTRLTAKKGGSALGRSTVLGAAAWEVTQRIRVRMGPMSLRKFERMLPGIDGNTRLKDWVRLYAGDECGCDAVLILKASEVPRTQLGVQGRLGWTTWILKEASVVDRDDSVVTVAA